MPSYSRMLLLNLSKQHCATAVWYLIIAHLVDSVCARLCAHVTLSARLPSSFPTDEVCHGLSVRVRLGWHSQQHSSCLATSNTLDPPMADQPCLQHLPPHNASAMKRRKSKIMVGTPRAAQGYQHKVLLKKKGQKPNLLCVSCP